MRWTFHLEQRLHGNCSVQDFVDVDDHASKVLSALAVVGDALLVGGVNGDI